MDITKTRLHTLYPDSARHPNYGCEKKLDSHGIDSFHYALPPKDRHTNVPASQLYCGVMEYDNAKGLWLCDTCAKRGGFKW